MWVLFGLFFMFSNFYGLHLHIQGSPHLNGDSKSTRTKMFTIYFRLLVIKMFTRFLDTPKRRKQQCTHIHLKRVGNWLPTMKLDTYCRFTPRPVISRHRTRNCSQTTSIDELGGPENSKYVVQNCPHYIFAVVHSITTTADIRNLPEGQIVCAAAVVAIVARNISRTKQVE